MKINWIKNERDISEQSLEDAYDGFIGQNIDIFYIGKEIGDTEWYLLIGRESCYDTFWFNTLDDCKNYAQEILNK